ncbi:hypothetical protein [Nitrospira sp. KM1]|uniref:hypothetical protein n=1 Tax=Nitrospira sp. KM1 TaxID=1936990 RepID=UPI001564BFBC|nr:hypothetical protein [Nitrospira sp. KM1]
MSGLSASWCWMGWPVLAGADEPQGGAVSGTDRAPRVEEAGVEQEPDAELEPDREGPRRQPRFLPPRLRPRELTPEEREEAEYLKKLAAKYGTDPTAIVGRVQLSGAYADLRNDAHASDGTLRIDVPFRKDWLLRVDTPFVKWSDPSPNRAGIGSAAGFSDMFVTLGWRAYNTPEYAFLIGALTTLPTASVNTLGTGKYTAGPIIATARFLSRWESFLFGIFQHQMSVGGDPSRTNVSLTRATAQINTIWAERWWTVVQAVWQVNWERSAKSSMTMELETGRSLIGRWGAYLRPGVGIWGQSLAGAYEWNVEVGVRYMFPSF